MKSKAAIKGHPVHPMLVPLPIGAWALALIGDIVYASTANGFWYQFSYYAMLVGFIGALVAAIFGLTDYLGVRMSEAGHRSATTHLILNLIVVVVYAVNLWLRKDFKATTGSAWTLVFTLEVLSFLTLAVSGWIGGELSYRHKIGILEHEDPQATEIGMNEPVTTGRAAPRTRGLQG